MSGSDQTGGARLTPIDRASMAPIAAAMYAVAAVLVAVSALILPRPEAMNRTALMVAATGALAYAGAVWLLRRRLPLWFFQVSTAGGSVLIGLAVYWGGESSSPYALLVLWVAI